VFASGVKVAVPGPVVLVHMPVPTLGTALNVWLRSHSLPPEPALAFGETVTTTDVVAILWQPKLLVTLRVYVPAIAIVALADTVGFCRDEVKPLGPVHAYVVIPAGPPVRVNAVPEQTGPLFDAVAVGVAGCALTTTLAEDAEVHPAALDTV
jgi:hypothetical protein